MIRRPPRSTRTDTLFPDTTLFRSIGLAALVASKVSRPYAASFPQALAALDRGHTSPAALAAGLEEAEILQQLGQTQPALVCRSEEHTSELQSLMRISYAVFCLKKKKHKHILQLHTIPIATKR